MVMFLEPLPKNLHRLKYKLQNTKRFKKLLQKTEHLKKNTRKEMDETFIGLIAKHPCH